MRTSLPADVRRAVCDRHGVFAAEYAVLAVGVVVVVASALVGFRGTMLNAVNGVGSAIQTTQSSIASR